MKLAVLFIQAVILVLQWLKDRDAAGVQQDQALRELTDAINSRIAAAKSARTAANDDRVRDPNDRG